MKKYILVRNNQFMAIDYVYGVEKAYEPGDVVIEVNCVKDNATFRQVEMVQVGGYKMKEEES
jgi:predicted methyltransferase MtxX (methanogen marker protein 4)